MWKKACLSLVLAALLPQAVTFAAYGDIIGTEPVPQVTAPAPPVTVAKVPATVMKEPTTAAKVPATVTKVPTTAAKVPSTVTKVPTAAAKVPTVSTSTPITPVPTTPKPEMPIEPKPTLPAAPKPVTPAPAVTPKPVVPAKTPAPGQLVPEAVTKPQVTIKPKTAPEEVRRDKKSSEKKSITHKTTVYKAVYEQGDSGWKVREAQRRMRLLGYKLDNDQGHFTKDMAKQLKKFQRHAKLKANGKLDEKTYEALGWEVFDKTGIQKIKAREILSTASKYKGVPYRFGGTTPKGFDCSGYVQYVFKQRGAQLTRTADTQFLEGVAVRRSQLKPGDLVFFTTYEPGASHVGIYAGGGQFWNATSSRGVMLCQLSDSYWGPRYYGARRVLATNGEEKFK